MMLYFLYTFPVLNAPGIGAIPSEFCNSDCFTLKKLELCACLMVNEFRR